MNIRPPRESAARNAATLPPLNARIRKSCRRNMGASTRRSTNTKITSRTAPPTSAAITPGAVQPIVWPP